MPRKTDKPLPHPADLNAGIVLRSLRTWRRMTQAQLAEKLDLTFQQIQKYENGTSRMTVSTLYKLSCILDAPILNFFAGLDESKKDIKDIWLSKEEIQLIKTWRTLTEETLRRSLLQMIETLAEHKLDGFQDD